jgi:solute carrier family 25 folate transporter 32
MTYEQMKKLGVGRLQGDAKDLTNIDYLLFSGLSKMLAGSVTYPYQVVRARLQTYDADAAYKNARDVVAQVWRREGMSGFYKGLGLNLLRVVPSSCVTLLVYENTKWYLPRMLDET